MIEPAVVKAVLPPAAFAVGGGIVGLLLQYVMFPGGRRNRGRFVIIRDRMGEPVRPGTREDSRAAKRGQRPSGGSWLGPRRIPAGGSRRYQPVYVPWGMVAGKWMIGGVSFGETLATALGIPFVLGKAQGISRARYYPDMKKILVKLLAEPGSGRLIGAQMVGGEGIKERADFLAMAVKVGITLEDLAFMENVYSPPIGALNEPIALAAQNGLANLGHIGGTPNPGA